MPKTAANPARYTVVTTRAVFERRPNPNPDPRHCRTISVKVREEQIEVEIAIDTEGLGLLLCRKMGGRSKTTLADGRIVATVKKATPTVWTP